MLFQNDFHSNLFLGPLLTLPKCIWFTCYTIKGYIWRYIKKRIYFLSSFDFFFFLKIIGCCKHWTFIFQPISFFTPCLTRMEKSHSDHCESIMCIQVNGNQISTSFQKAFFTRFHPCVSYFFMLAFEKYFTLDRT